MGNCMETYCCIMRQEEELEVKMQQYDEEEEGGGGKGSGDDIDGKKNNGGRVKVVLTKEELKWLILQLSEKGGEGMKLEQVLQEIERGRGSSGDKAVEGSPWKPSLESILEAPEMLEIDR